MWPLRPHSVQKKKAAGDPYRQEDQRLARRCEAPIAVWSALWWLDILNASRERMKQLTHAYIIQIIWSRTNALLPIPCKELYRVSVAL